MMTSAYERRLILSYLSNAFTRFHSGDAEARNLLQWAQRHEDQLKIPHPLAAGGNAKRTARRKSQDEEVTVMEWHQAGSAMKSALAAAGKARPDRTARRIGSLAKATRLSRTDTAVLELLLRYQTVAFVESMIDYLGQGTDWRRNCFRLGNPVLPCLLGLSAGAVYSRFVPDAPLMTSGLVSVDEDGDVTLIERLKRLHWLPKEAGFDVQSLLLDAAGPSELRWTDFDHVAGDRDHLQRLLDGALQCGRKGVNILVHGQPGTGKTEFCKTVAACLEVPLYAVGESDSVGAEPSRKERMQELRLAQRLLAGDQKAILLFDEMEDLLSGPQGMLAALLGPRRSHGFSAEGSKVFMNRLLEGTRVPVLWTSNSARWTSPVLLRRMMFALELRQPPPRVRKRIWLRHLAHHGIESTQEDAQALAREFDVTPGVASGVTTVAGLGGGAIADVRRGVQGLARVLSGDMPPTQGAPERYDPALIRADVDPVQLADRLVNGGARHFSVCLQGPPGTGKSAFVRHLADRLGLEVIQKRASDLMSKWVGETEKATAAAFTEARDAEAFLVFDEADSLLADRRLAQRSWEVSQVNEMLTWMESHPLPFACTTNFGERLDTATLRRFTFKIALGHLSPEQVVSAFRIYFGIEPPAEVAGLATLTPGDFSVVRRKAEILDCLEDPRTLGEMLYEECSSKPDHGRRIGFNLQDQRTMQAQRLWSPRKE